MNGMSGAVAIAGSGGGLWAVEGGNDQVPQGLISRSNATVHLSTTITGVEEEEHITGEARYRLKGNDDILDVECSAVVVAAPLELSNIEFTGKFDEASSWNVGRQYQRTVASFVRGKLSLQYFGVNPPEMILTTAGASAPFSSLARIRASGMGDYFFKIFSKLPLKRSALDELFEAGADVVYEHNWLAYPQVSTWHGVYCCTALRRTQ